MKLYGALASPYVARVVLFSRLKGLALEPQMPEGGLKSPAFLAKNPMGKMPALEFDGMVVAESEVICEYLEDLYPGTGGLPGGPAERARARLISRVHDVYVSHQLNVLFRNMNPAKRDATAVATATSEFEKGLAYLDHFVAAAPYAAGPQLSLADCTLLPSLLIMRKTVIAAFGLADPTSGDGKLGRWWTTISSDPVTGPFVAECSAAQDRFLKMLAGK
jgi:glutathione S-transferase